LGRKFTDYSNDAEQQVSKHDDDIEEQGRQEARREWEESVDEDGELKDD
jgi:hypothetical protein